MKLLITGIVALITLSDSGDVMISPERLTAVPTT